jgi:uncharacterized protein YqeY
MLPRDVTRVGWLTTGEPMSEPSILERIQQEMVVAMKSQQAATLGTLRMLKSALMEAKTKKAKDAALTSDEEVEILQRYAKKRREAVEEFRKLGREDLIPSEEAEITVTERFLPRAMDDAELRAIVQAAIASTGATGPREMGKVIGVVMPQVKGRADGSRVSRLVKETLGG